MYIQPAIYAINRIRTKAICLFISPKPIYTKWSSTTNIWIGLFLIAGCLLVFIITMFYRISCNVLHSVASDLGLHCLQIALLGFFKLKLVKGVIFDDTCKCGKLSLFA